MNTIIVALRRIIEITSSVSTDGNGGYIITRSRLRDLDNIICDCYRD